MKIAKNIRATAIRVLNNEANAIENVTKFINDEFESCVSEIFNSTGRVVITGIGKSALIASKIVATLNSTGTPALFMHAADALHGDLGMVRREDIVICISKSGNTEEIKALVPLLKRTGSKLVALVSNTESYLAKQADFVLNGSIGEEACPNNLAPTTSTTVHLALGDALAVCLLELRGFTSDDFAKNHPGGALGKKLYLRVEDIYPSHQLPMVGANTPVKDVIVEISSKRLGAAAVVDGTQKLKGIITDGDIRRMLERHSNLTGLTAQDIMTVNPKTVGKGEFATRALQVMQENNITQLVVEDESKVVGFVHLHDLLKEGIV
ncbi:MAG: KpsF/GutQ family sugar-phosphate isomerase [Bacteroidetes bacterium]|nr:KpsF/GutQ family sugar-phosphate isomerase [Bacteroidota bacterium]